jgi:hypothetical protein
LTLDYNKCPCVSRSVCSTFYGTKLMQLLTGTTYGIRPEGQDGDIRKRGGTKSPICTKLGLFLYKMKMNS